MKKVWKILVPLLIIAFVVGFVVLKYASFGNKKINIFRNFYLTVPNLSYKINEKEGKFITFKTIKSYSALQKELDNLFKSYKLEICNYDENYYDEKGNVTIKNYTIEKGFLFNKYTIEYIYGEPTFAEEIQC